MPERMTPQNCRVKKQTPVPLAGPGYAAALRQTPAPVATPKLPMATGRSSLPDQRQSGRVQINGVNYEELLPEFALEWIPKLEYLAAYNEDVGYAVENVIQLANNGHDIFFADDLPDSYAREMLAYLTENRKTWYQYSNGVNSLTNDLLAQAVISGAVSAEIIPAANLRGIEQIERIRVDRIRFIRQEKNSQYLPVQQVEGNWWGRLYSQQYKVLNPVTYKYIALRRLHNGPYATPPFLTALQSADTKAYMMDNMRFVMRKLGMFGPLMALIKPLERGVNETENAFFARSQQYLNEQIAFIENFHSEGILAGFEGTHTFEMANGNMDVSGAETLLKMIELQVYSGLKQDPNMMGRQQSTTETFGRVLLAKLTTQISTYQETVATFLEELYYMALLLAGYNPGKVTIKFKKSLIGDQLREEQTYQALLQNLQTLRQEGIINQQDFATEAGYDEPALPAPLTPPAPTNPAPPAAEGDGEKKPDADQDVTDAKTTESNRAQPQRSATARRLAAQDARYAAAGAELRQTIVTALAGRLHGPAPVFDYAVPAGCEPAIVLDFKAATNWRDKLIETFVTGYASKIGATFRRAVSAVTADISRALSNLPVDAPVNEVQETVIYQLYSRWEAYFVKKIAGPVNAQVNEIYGYYRGDEKVYGRGSTPPAVELGRQDFRTLEYLRTHDKFYLGKFITDPDTIQRVQAFISRNYVTGDAPVGANKKAVAAFTDAFKENLTLEAFKIRRVIDTSVNKMRNYGHVSYLKQGEVTEFKVMEVNDSRTCGHCQHMDGKTFKVATAYEKMERVTTAGPEQTPTLNPFATQQPLETFTQLTAEQLQASGYDTPPYHPHCRGRIVEA